MAEHRRARRGLVGAAGLVGVSLVAVAFRRSRPIVLPAIGVLVGGVALVRHRQAISVADARHRPSGRLGGSAVLVTDPDHLLDMQQQFGDVFTSHLFRQPMACVAGMSTISTVLADDGLLPAPRAFNSLIPGGFLRWRRGDDHRRLRGVTLRAMDAEFIEHARPVVHDAMSNVVSRLDGEVGSRDLTSAVKAAVLDSQLDVVLGVGRGDPRLDGLRSALVDLDPANGLPLDEMERVFAAAERILGSEVGERGSVPSVLARSEADERNGNDPGLVRNLLMLARMSSNDIMAMIAWIVWYLADAPHWLAEVRDEAASPTLPDRIVDEALRLGQSEYLMRRAGCDIEAGDRVIPAGWLVRFCVKESHRDPTVFADPDAFDPDRIPTPASGSFRPFGIGVHSCTGAQLTRLYGRAFVMALARDFDIGCVRGGQIEMSANRHWAPSPDAIYRFTRRGSQN